MLDFYTAGNQRIFENWRLNGRPGRVVAYRHVETDCPYPGCGWDEFTQSGKLTGCPTCGGGGKIFSVETRVLRARAVWGQNAYSFYQPSSGVELGDVTLGIIPADVPLMEEIVNEQRSYLVVDGKTVRPLVIAPSILPGIGEGSLVSCNLYTDATA